MQRMQILVVLVVRRFWCTPWKGRTWWKWGTRKAGQLKGGAVVSCHYVQVFDKLKQKELHCWTTSTWGHSKTRKTLGVSSPMSTQGTDAELERKAMKSRVWYDVIPWFDLPHQLPWHENVAKDFCISMFACLTWAFQQPMWGIASEADKAFAAWRNAMKWSDSLPWESKRRVDASSLFTFSKRLDTDFFCGLCLGTLFIFLQNVHRAAGCSALAVFLWDEVH